MAFDDPTRSGDNRVYRIRFTGQGRKSPPAAEPRGKMTARPCSLLLRGAGAGRSHNTYDRTTAEAWRGRRFPVLVRPLL